MFFSSSFFKKNQQLCFKSCFILLFFFSSGFLPNYLLPDYEEVVNRPPTPPPPYSALNTGPNSVASSPLAPEQQEGHCPTTQPTPLPQVSDGLCSRPGSEEPQPTTLEISPKPDNKPLQTAQDSGLILRSDGLSSGGSLEKRSENGDDTCKDPLLKDLSEVSADDKDRLPNGRRRRFTGDSGIEMCVCGTRGSGGLCGAGGTGQEDKETRELETLLGREGDDEEGDFCDSCGQRASFSVEDEQVVGVPERRGPRGLSAPPPSSLQPPVCLLLHTINEQEGPHHSTEPQG